MKFVNALFDRWYERRSWPQRPAVYWDRFYGDPIESVIAAAEAGDANAAFVVGDRFDQGHEVEPDRENALGWYRIAAKRNQPDAINNLGSMHEHGEGVEQDDMEARRRYEAAAAAMTNLGHMRKRGRAGFKRDGRKAARLFENAGALFDANGALSAGFAFDNDDGVRRNGRRALYWYRRAADLCSASAFNNLGAVYWAGDIVPSDPTRAVRLFWKAYALGHRKCAYFLAIAHRDGEGAERDIREAMRLLLIAEEAGNDDAGETARELLAKHPELIGEAAAMLAPEPS